MIDKERVAFVSGAGSGIGREVALSLAGSGVKVVVFDLNADHAAATVKMLEEVGGSGLAVSGDVSNHEDVEHAVDAAVKNLGRIDILVNCAGVLIDSTIKKLDEKTWDKVQSINLKGTFLLIQAAMKVMSEQKYGRIVTLASGAYLGNFGQAAYAASKAGVVSLTKTAALECAKHGITVNCVAPGLVKTPMTEGMPEEAYAALAKGIPMGRIGEPRDIANIILALVADESDYITGQIIHVDGGATTGIRM